MTAQSDTPVHPAPDTEAVTRARKASSKGSHHPDFCHNTTSVFTCHLNATLYSRGGHCDEQPRFPPGMKNIPSCGDSCRNMALSSRPSLGLAWAKDIVLLKVMSPSRDSLHPVTEQCGHQGPASGATRNTSVGPGQLQSHLVAEWPCDSSYQRHEVQYNVLLLELPLMGGKYPTSVLLQVDASPRVSIPGRKGKAMC